MQIEANNLKRPDLLTLQKVVRFVQTQTREGINAAFDVAPAPALPRSQTAGAEPVLWPAVIDGMSSGSEILSECYGATLYYRDGRTWATETVAILPMTGQTLEDGDIVWAKLVDEDAGVRIYLAAAGSGAKPAPCGLEWYTEYHHLGVASVSVGQVLAPRATIGTLGVVTSGAHAHFVLGDGSDFFNTTNYCVVGQSLDTDDWWPWPKVGARDPGADPPVYDPPVFAGVADQAAARAYVRSVTVPFLPATGYKQVYGSAEHKGGEYYAVDVTGADVNVAAVPPDQSMAGTAVTLAIGSAAVESTVVYVRDFGAGVGSMVVVRHRPCGCDGPWKRVVRCATTTAGDLDTDYVVGSVVDDVTLALRDPVLVKDSASPSGRGIFTANTTGAPTRRWDADTGAELNGATVYVSEGTANGKTIWAQTLPVTVFPGGATSWRKVWPLGSFGRLTTSSAGRWKWIPVGLDGTGAFVDTGAESATYDAVAALDDTLVATAVPVAGMVAYFTEARALAVAGTTQYEFLPVPTVTVFKITGAYSDGYPWALQVWDGTAYADAVPPVTGTNLYEVNGNDDIPAESYVVAFRTPGAGDWVFTWGGELLGCGLTRDYQGNVTIDYNGLAGDKTDTALVVVGAVPSKTADPCQSIGVDLVPADSSNETPVVDITGSIIGTITKSLRLTITKQSYTNHFNAAKLHVDRTAEEATVTNVDVDLTATSGYTGGTGITISGTTISIDLATFPIGCGLASDGKVVKVDLTGSVFDGLTWDKTICALSWTPGCHMMVGAAGKGLDAIAVDTGSLAGVRAATALIVGPGDCPSLEVDLVSANTTAESPLTGVLIEASAPNQLKVTPTTTTYTNEFNLAGLHTNRTAASPVAGTPVYVTLPSAYRLVQDEGSPLAAREVLNFVGGIITATDDAGGTRTNVTVALAGDNDWIQLDGATIRHIGPKASGHTTKNSPSQIVYDAKGHIVSVTEGTGTGPAPNAPGTLSAAAGVAQIVWTWSAPSGGQAPTSYRLQVSTDSTFATLAGAGSGEFTTIAPTVTKTTTGHTNGVLLYGRVCGVYNGASGPWSNTASATPSGTLLADTYTANTGTLSGRAVESGTATPVNWAVTAGTWTVGSGTVKMTADASSYAVAESGDADVTVEVTHAPEGSLPNVYAGGVIFRYTDANNNWGFYVEDDVGGTDYVTLIKRSGGVNTVIGTAGTTRGTHTLKVVTSGNTITCYLDGVAVGACSTTDAFNNAATKHGIAGFRNAGGGGGYYSGTFDNWSVLA